MAIEAKRLGINHKQWLFVQEFIVDHNATRAAERAGYSPRTVHVQGPRQLGKVRVQAAIAEAEDLKAKTREITIERVLEEMRRLAFAQTTDMVELKGGWVTIKDTESLTTEQKSAISQIKQKKDGEIEVKFYDKQKAIEMLAKYLGIFSDVNTGQSSTGVQPQINIVFGDAPALDETPRAEIIEGEVRELPEGEQV